MRRCRFQPWLCPPHLRISTAKSLDGSATMREVHKKRSFTARISQLNALHESDRRWDANQETMGFADSVSVQHRPQMSERVSVGGQRAVLHVVPVALSPLSLRTHRSQRHLPVRLHDEEGQKPGQAPHIHAHHRQRIQRQWQVLLLHRGPRAARVPSKPGQGLARGPHPPVSTRWIGHFLWIRVAWINCTTVTVIQRLKTWHFYWLRLPIWSRTTKILCLVTHRVPRR